MKARAVSLKLTLQQPHTFKYIIYRNHFFLNYWSYYGSGFCHLPLFCCNYFWDFTRSGYIASLWTQPGNYMRSQWYVSDNWNWNLAVDDKVEHIVSTQDTETILGKFPDDVGPPSGEKIYNWMDYKFIHLKYCWSLRAPSHRLVVWHFWWWKK